jgi:hypothetical protein
MIKFCYYWEFAGIPWKNGNWTWADCELVQEICATWSNQGVWWKNENLIWSQCSQSFPPALPVQLQPVGLDATTLIQPWQAEEQWNPYRAGEFNKRKRLIKLICKVKGQTYEEEKEVGDMKISVDDVKMVVKAVTGIDLDVKLEEQNVI